MEALQKAENSSKPIGDIELDGLIRKAAGQEQTTDDRVIAEQMAFSFAPDYEDKEHTWGLYYGPMMVIQNEAGQWVESPSIKLVTDGVVKHWEARAISS